MKIKLIENITEIPDNLKINVLGERYLESFWRKIRELDFSITDDGKIDLVYGFTWTETSITNLPIYFNVVGHSFEISHNKLTSLDGCPKEVGGDYWVGKHNIKFSEEYVRKNCNVGSSVMIGRN